MTKLRYPADPVFFRNLILQRTDALTSLVGPGPLQAWLTSGDTSPIESYFYIEKIRDQALKKLEEDFNRDLFQIAELLGDSTTPKTIVSIGPGNGLLEVLLLKQFPAIDEIVLIDIEQSLSHHHGYAQQGAGYADLNATKTFMTNNDINDTAITLCNPLYDKLPDIKFDLLISILSMGFHYPCDSYASYMIKNLSPAGSIIIDKRKSAPDAGFETLVANQFEVAYHIDFGKFDRVLVRRRAQENK